MLNFLVLFLCNSYVWLLDSYRKYVYWFGTIFRIKLIVIDHYLTFLEWFHYMRGDKLLIFTWVVGFLQGSINTLKETASATIHLLLFFNIPCLRLWHQYLGMLRFVQVVISISTKGFVFSSERRLLFGLFQSQLKTRRKPNRVKFRKDFWDCLIWPITTSFPDFFPPVPTERERTWERSWASNWAKRPQ